MKFFFAKKVDRFIGSIQSAITSVLSISCACAASCSSLSKLCMQKCQVPTFLTVFKLGIETKTGTDIIFNPPRPNLVQTVLSEQVYFWCNQSGILTNTWRWAWAPTLRPRPGSTILVLDISNILWVWARLGKCEKGYCIYLRRVSFWCPRFRSSRFQWKILENPIKTSPLFASSGDTFPKENCVTRRCY